MKTHHYVTLSGRVCKPVASTVPTHVWPHSEPIWNNEAAEMHNLLGEAFKLTQEQARDMAFMTLGGLSALMNSPRLTRNARKEILTVLKTALTYSTKR